MASIPNHFESELNSFQTLLPTKKDISHWKANRRSSIDLLEMSDIPSVQSNIYILREPGFLQTDSKRSKIDSNQAEDKKTLNESLLLFDPLKQDQRKSKEIGDGLNKQTTNKNGLPPTRLPTPKKAVMYKPLDDDTTQKLNNNENSVRSNQIKSPTLPSGQHPTPPSSPGKRMRHHSSIARLVRLPTKDISEFDPLVTLKKKSATPRIDTSQHTIVPKRQSKSSNDLLIFSPDDSSPSKAGPQIGESNTTNDLMKSQEKLSSTKQCGSTTRIPLPKSNRTSMIMDDEIIDETLKKLPRQQQIFTSQEKFYDQVVPSKLKQPEIKVPESVKMGLPKRKSSTFPNYDLLQDQEGSKRLSATLISAQGLISQPETPIVDLHHSTLGDRLLNLVEPNENEKKKLSSKQNSSHAMSPKFALNRYRSQLSEYEKVEILDYPNVYFVGANSKKVMAHPDEPEQNFGYDDEHGDYQLKIKDHLNYRYEVIELLGKGSFGQVLKCRDHKANGSDSSTVAVKIIRNNKKFHTQAQTEIKILEQLIKWDPNNKAYNVRMLDQFEFREHLCIVFECLSLNLYEILENNDFQGFSMGLVKRFAFQILSSLKLLSEHNVIHCDLKPENILLKQPDRSGIRVIDFGSSCYINEKVYTYIQSRFYRAPEIILGMEYGLPIDMWSTGCILAELYTGKPLFPGENEPDQLACIMQLIGVPKKEYLDKCVRRKQFFDLYDHPRQSINSKGKKRKPNSLTFAAALRRSTYDQCDKEFIDFISRCLTWEPEKRITPVEALTHPWVQTIKK